MFIFSTEVTVNPTMGMKPSVVEATFININILQSASLFPLFFHPNHHLSLRQGKIKRFPLFRETIFSPLLHKIRMIELQCNLESELEIGVHLDLPSLHDAARIHLDVDQNYEKFNSIFLRLFSSFFTSSSL